LFAGFLKSNGLTMTKVPYRSPVEAVNDLAEGRVQVYEASLAVMRPQLQAGKIKLLAVTNSMRAPTEPGVPTVQEVGYPELTLDGLVGFFGPPRMPLALRERIASEVREVMAADPVIGERLNLTGQLPNSRVRYRDRRATRMARCCGQGTRRQGDVLSSAAHTALTDRGTAASRQYWTLQTLRFDANDPLRSFEAFTRLAYWPFSH
jgi:Tripartite tricarboxylate transporter family receptor